MKQTSKDLGDEDIQELRRSKMVTKVSYKYCNRPPSHTKIRLVFHMMDVHGISRILMMKTIKNCEDHKGRRR